MTDAPLYLTGMSHPGAVEHSNVDGDSSTPRAKQLQIINWYIHVLNIYMSDVIKKALLYYYFSFLEMVIFFHTYSTS